MELRLTEVADMIPDVPERCLAGQWGSDVGEPTQHRGALEALGRVGDQRLKPRDLMLVDGHPAVGEVVPACEG